MFASFVSVTTMEVKIQPIKESLRCQPHKRLIELCKEKCLATTGNKASLVNRFYDGWTKFK